MPTLYDPDQVLDRYPDRIRRFSHEYLDSLLQSHYQQFDTICALLDMLHEAYVLSVSTDQPGALRELQRKLDHAFNSAVALGDAHLQLCREAQAVAKLTPQHFAASFWDGGVFGFVKAGRPELVQAYTGAKDAFMGAEAEAFLRGLPME